MAMQRTGDLECNHDASRHVCDPPSQARAPGSSLLQTFQHVKQPALVALAVFSWLQTWWAMAGHAVAICSTKDAYHDNREVVPLLILVTGMAVTNVLGFLAPWLFLVCRRLSWFPFGPREGM